MPRVIHKTVYKYEELTERAKERARQWYTSDGLDYEWWEATYEDAKRMLTLLGFVLSEIHFDSHYDVTFTGHFYVTHAQIENLKTEAPLDKDLHAIADTIASLRNDILLAHDPNSDDEPTFPSASIGISGGVRQIEASTAHEEDIVLEILRRARQWVSLQLRKEEEYLTSDEVVAENICANEYEFDGQGARA